MITINEKLYNKMPNEVKICFNELPSPERDEVVSGFPDKAGGSGGKFNNKSLFFKDNDKPNGYTDQGSASRFFYCAKSSKRERNQGLEGFEEKTGGEATHRKDGSDGLKSPRAGAGRTGRTKNFHPTVKPLKLMQYLTRLITPKGGTVLDPYMGSGTTGMACKSEGFDFIGIELDEEYFKIAKARIEKQERKKLIENIKPHCDKYLKQFSHSV